MKVLVIGNGGREHTLVWKISQSKRVKKIYCAPGNAGIMTLAENIDIQPTEIDNLKNFVKKEKIDLTVVGPEIPLVLGIVDKFEKEKIPIIGPSKDAAQLEGSKAFARQLMKKYHIPQPEYGIFTESEKAKAYLKNKKLPIVIKANGLAAGKGVIIAKTKKEAEKTIYQIMVEKKFKEAGKKVVIEEYLEGYEVSILAFTDGQTILPMVTSQDHKKVFDNDKGPNTGGMGAYSPVTFITSSFFQQIIKTILMPTIKAMAHEGYEYKGILYAGLMITSAGCYVLEFNCRFGDPETQVILPRLKTDIISIFEAIQTKKLESINLNWKDEACVCVVLSSGGYPEKYEIGKEITGLEKIPENILLFHAGTKYVKDKIVSTGGRVLCVTGLDKNIKIARKKIYQAIKKIKFDKMHYRKDIGIKTIKED